MDMILLCSESKKLQEHWRESLIDVYSNIVSITSQIGLEKCFEQYTNMIILLDCNFFINKQEYIKSILSLKPEAKILYMDDCPSFKIGKNLLAYNIKGYANSRLSSIHLLQAVSVIDNGNVWLYPEFVQELIKDIAPSSISQQENEGLSLLTPKEKSISNFVAKGFNNRQIAEQVEISESTVKNHLRSIFDKLQIADRLSLALLIR